MGLNNKNTTSPRHTVGVLLLQEEEKIDIYFITFPSF
jgi:hypothetical protein